MLDLKELRTDTERLGKLLAIRGYQLDQEQFAELESTRRSLQTKTESLQADRNAKSKAVGKAKSTGENADAVLAELSTISTELDEIGAVFAEHQKKYDAFVAGIPNFPDSSVPAGISEKDNLEIARWGEPQAFNFAAKDHVDLTRGEDMDFATAAKITGSRYVVLKSAVARLHRALTQFMLDTHSETNGYQEVYVPYIVNERSLYGTGQLPKFIDDQFRVETDNELDFYLTPTAEVPVTNMFREEIVDFDQLPLKFVCHSPCFRSEAGSYGRDTRGMIRQHQFEKVELVQLVHPDESWQAFEELIEHASGILEKLELPYRRVVLCGGDLGFSATKTVDLEVWLPGQDAYREISSCSHFRDFQARRMQARFRPQPKGKGKSKPELLHTLNGSGLAVGRTLVAVLENYQDGDGNVHVPDVLRPYMGGMQKIVLNPA